MIFIPMRTVPGKNAREHHMAKYRRVKAEKKLVAWGLVGAIRPALPCVVTLTRSKPNGPDLDDDNLVGSVAAVRDAVAKWIGVDDALRDVVRYETAQVKGPWGVRIEFETMVREDTSAGNGRMGEWCGA